MSEVLASASSSRGKQFSPISSNMEVPQEEEYKKLPFENL